MCDNFTKCFLDLTNNRIYTIIEVIYMRKSPTFPDRECTMCGKSYTPHSSQQKYCPDCKIIASKETKRRFYMKHNPNAYQQKPKEFCVVCGLPMESHFDGKPYCNKHWQRLNHHGTTEQIPYKTKNTYQIIDNVAIGTTSRGDTYKIDIEDLERCKQHSWVKDPRGYFVSRINHKSVTLHRFILGTKGNKVMTDHINGDRSDNRKENLRKCTQNENWKNLKVKKNNTSGHPGVEKTRSGKWSATIMVNRKEIHLGVYESKFDAINARRIAEVEYYGEFAPILCRLP